MVSGAVISLCKFILVYFHQFCVSRATSALLGGGVYRRGTCNAETRHIVTTYNVLELRSARKDSALTISCGCLLSLVEVNQAN